MLIQIKQDSISISDSYKIFVEGNISFIAKSKLFKTSAIIELFEINIEKSVFEIRKNSFEKKANYSIINFAKESIYQFEDINNIKLKYKCVVENDVYSINGNSGNKFSIFKNNTQIAYFNKSSIVFGEGDYYELICNKDSDQLLLISFVLCLDNNLSNFSKEGNLFTIDFGNFGNMLDIFDENWKPN